MAARAARLVMVAALWSLALTNILLRLLDRRKATNGLALKTLVQRRDIDKMLTCLWIRFTRENMWYILMAHLGWQTDIFNIVDGWFKLTVVYSFYQFFSVFFEVILLISASRDWYKLDVISDVYFCKNHRGRTKVLD